MEIGFSWRIWAAASFLAYALVFTAAATGGTPAWADTVERWPIWIHRWDWSRGWIRKAVAVLALPLLLGAMFQTVAGPVGGRLGMSLFSVWIVGGVALWSLRRCGDVIREARRKRTAGLDILPRQAIRFLELPLWPHAIGDRRIGAVAAVVLFAVGTVAAFVVPAAIDVVLSVYCLAGTWSVAFAVVREEARGR